MRFMLMEVFGFAECQEKAAYGFVYKSALTRNTDSSVFTKANATNNAKIKTNGIERYVSRYTP